MRKRKFAHLRTLRILLAEYKFQSAHKSRGKKRYTDYIRFQSTESIAICQSFQPEEEMRTNMYNTVDGLQGRRCVRQVRLRDA